MKKSKCPAAYLISPMGTETVDLCVTANPRSRRDNFSTGVRDHCPSLEMTLAAGEAGHSIRVPERAEAQSFPEDLRRDPGLGNEDHPVDATGDHVEEVVEEPAPDTRSGEENILGE